ncbi:NUDIX hydrolase [Lampropedia cohaerens]|uniref:NUDIX hydrolase n=1 Tax=Lampropedia cohaerens TaxID=1610491 RepID=UPI0006298606|nr:NUDIX domain-containing protein [Lampropedia cohaerens]
MHSQIRKSSRLIIIDNKNRLLLFRYRDEHEGPFWATVGGELKHGESYLDAAQRELWEETGLVQKIGPLLKERTAIYAVARSTPAQWEEKYFLVKCESTPEITKEQWTDEEKTTIQDWKWWSLSDMRSTAPEAFKPEWLPELLESIATS